MFESNPPPSPSERDLLAGVYVYIEGPEKVHVPPRGSGPPVPLADMERVPLTREELAGVYVYIEGPEKVYVPPRGSTNPPPAS